MPPDTDAQPESDTEAAPVVDTEQQRESEWLANHRRQLQRLQEEHPQNAGELAVMFGNPRAAPTPSTTG